MGGSGIVFDGPTNLLVNNGTIGTADGGTGQAVVSVSGATDVENAGTIDGSVQLAADPANLLHNLSGGTILAGPTIDLGSSGVLRNEGVLESGLSSVGATTTINGSLTEAPSGVLLVRVDEGAGQADHFHVTGSAQIGGVVKPVPVNKGHTVAGTVDEGNILVADGGLTTSGLTVQSSSAIELYALTDVNGAIDLTSTVDFSPAGLSAADSRIGALEAQIQSNGSSPLFEQIVGALVDEPTVAALEGADNVISGTGVSAVPMIQVETASAAMGLVTNRLDGWRMGDIDSQMTGKDLSPLVAGKDDRPARIWATLTASGMSGSGLSAQTYGGAIGVDGQLPSLPVLVGAAFTLSQTNFGLQSPNSHGRADDFGLMVYGIGRFGRAYASVIGYAGLGGTSYTRTLYELGLGLATSVRFTSLNAGGRFEAGYTFDAGLSGMACDTLRGVATDVRHAGFGAGDVSARGAGPWLSVHQHCCDAGQSRVAARRRVASAERGDAGALRADRMDARLQPGAWSCARAASRNCRVPRSTVPRCRSSATPRRCTWGCVTGWVRMSALPRRLPRAGQRAVGIWRVGRAAVRLVRGGGNFSRHHEFWLAERLRRRSSGCAARVRCVGVGARRRAPRALPHRTSCRARVTGRAAKSPTAARRTSRGTRRRAAELPEAVMHGDSGYTCLPRIGRSQRSSHRIHAVSSHILHDANTSEFLADELQ